MTALARALAEAPTARGEAARLAAQLAEVQASGLPRRMLYVHVALASPLTRRAHHLRLAREVLQPLLLASGGQAFALPNDDLAVLWRRGAEPELARARAQLDFLFAADPAIGRDPAAAAALHRVFALPDEAAEALALVAAAAGAPQPPPAAPAASAEDEPSLQALAPLLAPASESGDGASARLDIGTLDRIERQLAQTDLGSLLHRQSVCALAPDGSPVPQWEECFVAIGELRQRLAPRLDLMAEPWLFRHLTLALDRRVLAELAAPGALAGCEGLALNLNVATLLGADFLRFDAALPAGVHKRIVIELQRADLFADLDAFLLARDFARARGFRLCLDGLTHHALGLVDRRRLGLDLVKLVWSEDLAAPPAADAVAALAARGEAANLVLCRCDGEAALAWGQAQGIGLFQGRGVEARLSARRTR